MILDISIQVTFAFDNSMEQLESSLCFFGGGWYSFSVLLPWCTFRVLVCRGTIDEVAWRFSSGLIVSAGVRSRLRLMVTSSDICLSGLESISVSRRWID